MIHPVRHTSHTSKDLCPNQSSSLNAVKLKSLIGAAHSGGGGGRWRLCLAREFQGGRGYLFIKQIDMAAQHMRADSGELPTLKFRNVRTHKHPTHPPGSGNNHTVTPATSSAAYQPGSPGSLTKLCFKGFAEKYQDGGQFYLRRVIFQKKGSTTEKAFPWPHILCSGPTPTLSSMQYNQQISGIMQGGGRG